jgi:hypothetical protein
MPFDFEVSIDGKDWETIPEQIFYDSLYRHANRITPLIKDMLATKVMVYGNIRYRIICVKKE